MHLHISLLQKSRLSAAEVTLLLGSAIFLTLESLGSYLGSAVGARKAWVSEMHFVFKKWKWQFLVETEMRDANTEDQEGKTEMAF